MKGHGGGVGGWNRWRQSYGVILFLAFGAAIMGVMVVHKLRERRIFNLFVKEKDRQLISLHLLLQKERDYNKEAKRKSEEMKAKIYSLRTQKTELDGRILEMQSTISSLTDEQRTVESALEEKQNEIKSLQQDKETETNRENARVMALTETLKQKEAEIEDLKHRLDQYSVKVWSVSADDPSNQYQDFENSSKGGGENLNLNESTIYQEDKVGFTDMREKTGEYSQKLENSQNEVFREQSIADEKSTGKIQEKRTMDSRDEESVGMVKEKNNGNATETIDNQDEGVKAKDEYSNDEAMDGKENLNSQGGEGSQLGTNSRGGMKMEITYNSGSGGGYRVKGQNGYTNNQKRKRWRMLARKRRHRSSMNDAETDGVSMQNTRFHRDAQESEWYKRHRDGDQMQKLNRNQDQGDDKLEGYDNHRQGKGWEVKTDDWVRLEGREDKDSWKDTGKTGVSANVNSLKPQNSEETENMSSKGQNNVQMMSYQPPSSSVKHGL
ncbi:hypothetical protein U1Q18_001468 [Sarracenia purpurea var. burkii]